MWRWLFSRCGQSSSHSWRCPSRRDLHRREPRPRLEQLRAEVAVHVQHSGRLRHLREEIAQDLHVDGRSGDERRAGAHAPRHLVEEGVVARSEREVLGRRGRVGDEPAVTRVSHEKVEEELGRALHDRVVLAQEVAIAREQVVLPEVRAEPRARRRERAPARAVHRSGDAPDVRVLVEDPAPGAVVLAGDAGALIGHLADQPEERLRRLGEVGDLRGPVVHLEVDVRRVLRIPHRIHVGVPDALQVRRLRARASTRRSGGSARTGRRAPRGRDRSSRRTPSAARPWEAPSSPSSGAGCSHAGTGAGARRRAPPGARRTTFPRPLRARRRRASPDPRSRRGSRRNWWPPPRGGAPRRRRGRRACRRRPSSRRRAGSPGVSRRNEACRGRPGSPPTCRGGRGRRRVPRPSESSRWRSWNAPGCAHRAAARRTRRFPASRRSAARR